MSAQSRAFDAWLDSVLDGQEADAGQFARSAIGDVPKIETTVARLNPKLWPNLSPEGAE